MNRPACPYGCGPLRLEPDPSMGGMTDRLTCPACPFHEGIDGLCPVCGEAVHLCGPTKDGRLTASCGDAFPTDAWGAVA